MGWNASKLEKSWALYDVANSAYVLLVCSIVPIYFDKLLKDDGIVETNAAGFSYWAILTAIITILMVVIGPIMGSLSDKTGWRRPMFVTAVIVGAVSTVLMGISGYWMIFVLIYIVSQIAFNSSLTINDSMLNDVTTSERMDTVSSKAYSWGYIGSCIPFIACCICVLLSDFTDIVENPPLKFDQAVMISLVITALWWFFFTVPLMKNYQQKYSNDKGGIGFKGKVNYALNSIREIKMNKAIFLFIIAYFFYIDGVNSIISMSTTYAKQLGMESASLLLAMLLTQFVAFPSTLIMNRLSKKHGTHRLIIASLFIYLVISILAIFMDKLNIGDFNFGIYFLAFSVGLVQGGIQALSRSYFGKMIPKDKTGEYFGILDIFGKSASVIGATISAVIVMFTGYVNSFGVVLFVMFLVGLLLFYQSTKVKVYDQNEEMSA